MTTTKRKALLSIVVLILSAFALQLQAQQAYITISGKVRDRTTGKGIPYVNVTVSDEHVSTVTNTDGGFILKTGKKPDQVILTHVGYRTRRFKIGDQLENVEISMLPSTVMLSEILVTSGDAREILQAAVAKIPTNYSDRPELFRGFYRETTQRGHRYIYVAEAVVDMYKSRYTRPVSYDRVRIDKARRLVSSKTTDTLGAKVQGGPTLPIYVDVVKNLDYLFSAEEMEHYDYRMEEPTAIDDRPQVVISMRPRHILDYPLYFGKIYIDRATLAFSRVEIDLDMTDREKATRMMLVSKPTGVRFRPREMKLMVDYVLDDSVSRINYVRSASRFNCDWKRKLFHSSYRVTSEMVVTDRYPEAHQISGRSSFDPKSSLYDKVEHFEDPGFWGKDNIIEPTESLENAIDKLRKRITKDQ